ncbi:penicillin-binding protein [filamentous cyanobacterium CCP5]|nr:penicillin-binding protein [filamentous cyanobacterium CCP5]
MAQPSRKDSGWQRSKGRDQSARSPQSRSDQAQPGSDQRRRRPRYRRPLHLRLIFWGTLAVTTLAATGGVRSYRIWQAALANLPETEAILTYQREGTMTIRSADAVVLQKVGPASRDTIEYDSLPQDLINAFIAAEDRRFYEHNGVDFKGIGRALMANIRQRDVVEGASTITQQLARIVFLDQDRTLQRKVKEALLALQIEKDLTKNQILERYVNLVYLGAGAYGVADAAWVYFGKSVDDLTLAESALIAGMAPAPSLYSPVVDEAAARRQRDRVLDRMEAIGRITAAEAEAARNAGISTTPRQPKYLYSEFPYFTIYVQKQLAEILTPDQLEAGGLTVETSLNVSWQRKAEQTVENAIERYSGWQGFEQVALVAVDPRNGEIKAMVGGNDFNESQFNRVTQAQRQPGSTFKTFVYTTAIAAGFSPYKPYVDAKYVVDGYEPENYGDNYSGKVDLRKALQSSINIVAVKTLVDVGFQPVIDMAKRMGIKSELLPTYSLALGASEVNLLELTSGYGTLANKGIHKPVHGIRRVLNSQGEVIYQAPTEGEQAVDPETAAIMTWMLQGVVQGGTGSNAALGRPVAGKTGTSERNRDLWFVGYIPQLATGVWMGNDDSSPTYGASSTAAAVWRMFMSQLTDDIPVENFSSLPRLAGRKGSIEAQPVKPGKVIAAKAGASSDDSEEDSNNRPSSSSDSEESGGDRSSEPATARSSDGDSDSNPGGGQPVVNEDDSAPAPRPSPAAITAPPPSAPPPVPAPVTAPPAPNNSAPAPAPPIDAAPAPKPPAPLEVLPTQSEE